MLYKRCIVFPGLLLTAVLLLISGPVLSQEETTKEISESEQRIEGIYDNGKGIAVLKSSQTRDASGDLGHDTALIIDKWQKVYPNKAITLTSFGTIPCRNVPPDQVVKKRLSLNREEVTFESASAPICMLVIVHYRKK